MQLRRPDVRPHDPARVLLPDDNLGGQSKTLKGDGPSEDDPVVLWRGRGKVVITVRMAIDPRVCPLLNEGICDLDCF